MRTWQFFDCILAFVTFLCRFITQQNVAQRTECVMAITQLVPILFCCSMSMFLFMFAVFVPRRRKSKHQSESIFFFVLCSLCYKSLHVHDMAIISSCFHICLSMFDEGEWIAAMHCESNTYIIVCSAYLIPIYLLLRIFHLFCDFVCCHIMTMEFFPFVSHWANNKKSKYTESQFLFLFFGNSATWILMHSHGWQSSAGNTNRTLYVKWRICLCNVNYISAKKRLNVARPHLPAFKASNDYRQASSPGFTWCFFTRSTTSFHDVRPALAIFINICELLIFQLEIYSKMLIVNHG